MIRIEELGQASGEDARPALVVGKGPSVDHLHLLDLSTFRVFTLNHAIRLVPAAEGAHFIDMEALIESAKDLGRASWIFMPARPHVKMTQGQPVQFYRGADTHVIKDVWNQIAIYEKEPCHVSRQSPDGIGVLHFSAEGLFGVLGKMGFKKIYSIGVDGGVSYSKQFSELKPFANGRKTFDDQNAHLVDIVKHYGMTWEKLFIDTFPGAVEV